MVQYFNLAVLFWRFPVLHFLAVPLSAVPGTAKYDGNFLTVMKYGGNFLAVMKYGDQMGCQTTYLWCAIKWRASFLFLSEPVVMYLSFNCKIPLWFHHVTMPPIGKLSSLMENKI